MMKPKTVLISGAGIAGPTLAFWLQKAGFEPTLIERAPAQRGGGYVIDFWGLGYDIAEFAGLSDDINRVGYHVRELRVVDDEGKRVAGFGTNVFRELTGGRYVTLARSELSRLLFESIQGTVETLFDNEIVALEETGDRVQVELRRCGDRRYDLVIGADGLHSRVRNLAFGPQPSFEKNLGYVVAAFETRGYRPRDDDAYVMYAQPGRMIGRFSLRGDRTLFLFVFATNGAPLPSGLDRQKDALRARYAKSKWEAPQILDALNDTDELYFDSVSQIRMDRWSKGRVALVGDAAFCVSLLAGHGSALAITSAYVLAGELANAGARHEEAFANYETLLRPYIATKQQGAERFATAFAPRTRWGLWFRNQVIRAFAIPGLANFAVGREIVDRLELPDYLQAGRSTNR